MNNDAYLFLLFARYTQKEYILFDVIVFMIASIDSMEHIIIYLQNGDLVKLEHEILEGILVHSNKSDGDGIIYLSINDSKRSESGSGISVNDGKYKNVNDNFSMELFFGTENYRTLGAFGKLVLGQGANNDRKVDVIDWSKLNSTHRCEMEQLEFYHESRVNIPEIYY